MLTSLGQESISWTLVACWRGIFVQVCGAEHLGSKYILMSIVLLVEEVDSDEDGQQPEFSLVTGKYRKAKRFGGAASTAGDEGSSAVILRNNEGTVSVLRDSAAGAR